MRPRVFHLLLLTVVAAAEKGTLVQRVPPPAAVLSNPFEGSATAARSGAKLFLRECAPCHGQKREGRGKAPPLISPDVVNAQPGALFWILRNGSLKRGMPSFAHLPEPERWQIVTYLQTMRRNARE